MWSLGFYLHQSHSLCPSQYCFYAALDDKTLCIHSFHMVSLLHILRLHVFLDMKNIVCAAPPGAFFAILNFVSSTTLFVGLVLKRSGNITSVICCTISCMFVCCLHFWVFSTDHLANWRIFGVRSCFWTTRLRSTFNFADWLSILRSLKQFTLL
jgi:hypothetical protein